MDAHFEMDFSHFDEGRCIMRNVVITLIAATGPSSHEHAANVQKSISFSIYSYEYWFLWLFIPTNRRSVNSMENKFATLSRQVLAVVDFLLQVWFRLNTICILFLIVSRNLHVHGKLWRLFDSFAFHSINTMATEEKRNF